ncbi:hypothetical protein M0657_007347 [Pyricularia oryzae]|uniref:Uncharacterized protein n=2 Tax=Pyricularia oryzae TaxID=318829 RepID=A0AA97NZN0_PYRO3|nr:hypothetical protein OOU_Y34scaffold00510g30 [Pyricularia oryzae Y34]KAI7918961.1 hypothetical protein M0657_007347 [Pyricularia oryzae]
MQQTSLHFQLLLLALLLLCHSSPALGQVGACTLKTINDNTCNQKTRWQKYLCLVDKYRLGSLVPCIEKDETEKDEDSNKLCQDGFDIFPTGGDDYSLSEQYQAGLVRQERGDDFCYDHKRVLMAGVRFRYGALRNPVVGSIRACPYSSEEQLWECLCDQQVTLAGVVKLEADFKSLSRCFGGGQCLATAKVDNLMCPGWVRPKTQPPQRAPVNSFVQLYDNATLAKREPRRVPVQRLDSLIGVWWDANAIPWPCYFDKANDKICDMGPSQLFYKDEPLPGGLMRRCFVHPLKPQRWCRTFKNPNPSPTTTSGPSTTSRGLATFTFTTTFTENEVAMITVDATQVVRAPEEVITATSSAAEATSTESGAAVGRPPPTAVVLVSLVFCMVLSI